MFDININENGDFLLSGRFDASQVEKAKKIFATINESIVVNFKDLEYISSAGLGVLLMTQKRLMGSQQRLKLSGMNHHIKEIFKYAGFDNIFEIE
jgi:anti-anti-sigma factor